MKIKSHLLTPLLIIFISFIFARGSFAGGADDVKGEEASIDTLKSSLKADPDNAKTYLSLGKLYNGIKEYELAQRHLDKAVALGIPESEAAYELGYALSRLGSYDAAKAKFKIAASNKDDEAKAYLESGYCNFKTKNFSQSEQDLNKAIESDPGLAPRAKLYKGIIKYEQGSFDEASAILSESLDTADDYSTRESARNYLAAVRNQTREDRDYMLIASLSFLYDDNVLTVSDSEPVRISDKEDIGGVGYIRGVYYPVKTEKNLLLLSYMFYQKFYKDLFEYDLQDHNALINYTRVFSDFTAVSLRYGYDYYSLNGDRYFQRNRFIPALTIKGSDSTQTEIRGLVENKEHYSSTELSSKNTGAGISQSIKFQTDTKLELSFDYNKEDTRSLDYEHEGMKFQVGVNQQFSYGYSAGVDLGFLKKNYDNIHSVFSVKREDEVQTAFFRIKKVFNEYMSGFLRYDYTLNDSNIRFYDYSRNVAFVEFKFIY